MGKASAASNRYTITRQSDGNRIEINWTEIEERLKNTLDDARYRHTLGVSYTAAAMAMAHNLDVRKARLAGLLHDCAKCVPTEIRLQLCEEFGIEVTEIEKKNTTLLHSKLGVAIAERDYGIDDPEIAGAIRWHTTGRPEMTKLEQVIYLADCIEPNRDEEMSIDPGIRKAAFTDLDLCCRMIMENAVEYIRTSGKDMDDQTLEAYNYYKSITKKTK